MRTHALRTIGATGGSTSDRRRPPCPMSGNNSHLSDSERCETFLTFELASIPPYSHCSVTVTVQSPYSHRSSHRTVTAWKTKHFQSHSTTQHNTTNFLKKNPSPLPPVRGWGRAFFSAHNGGLGAHPPFFTPITAMHIEHVSGRSTARCTNIGNHVNFI
jgi:hypothetical protein